MKLQYGNMQIRREVVTPRENAGCGLKLVRTEADVQLLWSPRVKARGAD